MAGLRGVFFDTSVLVAGMVELGPDSEAPFRLLDAVASGRIAPARTAWHCCLEFFSVTTRLPEEYRLDPDTALRFVQGELLGRFEVDALPARNRRSFLISAVDQGVSGGRIYDAHIAEVARRAGSEIVVTENRRHFTGLLRHGVRVLLSSELVAEL